MWIIGIFLHKFTNNKPEISTLHRASKCGIENFKFFVYEWVQVNPDNSQAMSVLTFVLFKLNTLRKKGQRLSQPKPWCNDSGVLNLHHGNDIKEVVS